MHYLYTVTQEQFNALKALYTEIPYENQRYSIDAKVSNQFVLVESTVYGNNKKYRWLNNDFANIEQISEFLSFTSY